MTNIVATMPNSNTENARWYDGKEQIAAFSVVALTDSDQFKEPVKVRIWMGKSRSATVVYCSIWSSRSGGHCCGTGRASGYGYHKQSAALAAALRSAGIVLSEDIGGRGDSAMRDALGAIAVALGYQRHRFTIVEH